MQKTLPIKDYIKNKDLFNFLIGEDQDDKGHLVELIYEDV